MNRFECSFNEVKIGTFVTWLTSQANLTKKGVYNSIRFDSCKKIMHTKGDISWTYDSILDISTLMQSYVLYVHSPSVKSCNMEKEILTVLGPIPFKRESSALTSSMDISRKYSMHNFPLFSSNTLNKFFIHEDFVGARPPHLIASSTCLDSASRT